MAESGLQPASRSAEHGTQTLCLRPPLSTGSCDVSAGETCVGLALRGHREERDVLFLQPFPQETETAAVPGTLRRVWLSAARPRKV